MQVRIIPSMLHILVILAAATDARAALECESLSRPNCDNSTSTSAAFDIFCKAPLHPRERKDPASFTVHVYCIGTSVCPVAHLG